MTSTLVDPAPVNGVKELMNFFNVPVKGICTDSPSDGKVTTPEFSLFWKSCTDAQKAYYKNAQL